MDAEYQSTATPITRSRRQLAFYALGDEAAGTLLIVPPLLAEPEPALASGQRRHILDGVWSGSRERLSTAHSVLAHIVSEPCTDRDASQRCDEAGSKHAVTQDRAATRQHYRHQRRCEQRDR